MSKFCGKCGSKIDEKTGLCPNCDAEQITTKNSQSRNTYSKKLTHKEKKARKKADKEVAKAKKKADKKVAKKEKKASRTTGQKIKRFFIKLLAIILALIIVVSTIMGTLVYFDIIDLPFIENVLQIFVVKNQEKEYSVTENDEEPEKIDIGEEIRNESQVLETIDVSTSGQVMTEKEVAEQFNERGFGDLTITTTYGMDGTYYSEKDVDKNSTEYHPLYYAVYSDDEYYWTIYCVNGEWSAIPLSYIYSGNATSQITVSETDYLMSYDSTTNCFYKIIPDESQCIVYNVSSIDAEMLEKLSAEEFSIS